MKKFKSFRFTNKYRTRIENRLAELIHEYQGINTELKTTSQTLRPEAYSKLWVKRQDIETQIILLKSLL